MKSSGGEWAWWERVHERGLARFVFVTGIGKVGLGFWVVFSVLDYLTRYGLTLIRPAPTAITLHFLGWIPGSIVVGAVSALCFWVVVSKQYGSRHGRDHT